MAKWRICKYPFGKFTLDCFIHTNKYAGDLAIVCSWILKGSTDMFFKLCFINQMKQMCKSVISDAVEQRHRRRNDWQSVQKCAGKLRTPLGYSPSWHAAEYMEKLFMMMNECLHWHLQVSKIRQPGKHTTHVTWFWFIFPSCSVHAVLQLCVVPSHADWQMERLRCYIDDA